jgi:CRP-like cAMP-binding protein
MKTIPHPHSRTPDPPNQLLAGIALDAQRFILAESQRRIFRPAQVLCQSGEPATQLFVLRKGRVQYSRLATTGQQVALGILAPGDVFGLGSLVAIKLGYLGTGEALEAGEAYVWDRDVILRLAEEHPQITTNALGITLRYVAAFVERHERLVAGTAGQRLAGALTNLGARTGTPSRHGIEVRVKNDQLASLADVSPFTASRLLRSLARSGVVSKSRGRVHILHPERLLVD